MVCVSKMRFCATQRAPRRVDKAENSPRLYKKYPGTVPAFCVITELLRVDRSVGPKGAKGDSPGQSEAPPWVRLRNGSIGSFALGEPFGPNLGGFRGR